MESGICQLIVKAASLCFFQKVELVFGYLLKPEGSLYAFYARKYSSITIRV